MAVSPWVTPAAVDRAAQACLQGKRSRPDAIAFCARYGEEVLALAERLARGDYAPEPGIVFVTERPKYREVHAAVFRDRGVHHLLHALLEPSFERRFISDSFACRPGKGTHAAALRLQEQMRRITRMGGQRAFALQMDIQGFFMSIHKPTLLGLLRGAPPEVLDLARRIVLHDPPAIASRRGDPVLFARVPPHKRLGASGPDRGLPIGNLTIAPRERVHVPRVGWISGLCRLQPIEQAAIEALRTTWSSYEGHLRHADAHRLRARLLERHRLRARLLRVRAGRLRRRFPLPRPAPSLAAQIQRLREGLDGAVLLLRIGAYAECARWQDARALGLRLSLRRGRGRTAGLPWRKVSGLVQRGLRRGLRVAIALEQSLPSGNVKARRLAYLFEPLSVAPVSGSHVTSFKS